MLLSSNDTVPRHCLTVAQQNFPYHGLRGTAGKEVSPPRIKTNPTYICFKSIEPHVCDTLHSIEKGKY